MLQSSHHDSAYAMSEDYANRPAFQTNCRRLVQSTDISDFAKLVQLSRTAEFVHVTALLLSITLDFIDEDEDNAG